MTGCPASHTSPARCRQAAADVEELARTTGPDQSDAAAALNVEANVIEGARPPKVRLKPAT
jgi:hypothetical protein